MTVDEAIQVMQSKISVACAAAEMKVARMSDEEARISVLAPAGDMQKIKAAINFLYVTFVLKQK